MELPELRMVKGSPGLYCSDLRFVCQVLMYTR